MCYKKKQRCRIVVSLSTLKYLSQFYISLPFYVEEFSRVVASHPFYAEEYSRVVGSHPFYVEDYCIDETENEIKIRILLSVSCKMGRLKAIASVL